MSSSSLSLTTNISSNRAQRRLGQAVSATNQAFIRLSSGLRINKASDDAAGLSVATSLQVDARVYTQGVRNLNDGASYLSIAEGAAEQLKNVVLRLRELSTQSANGVLGDSQRSNLDAEAQALQKEYNRILETAEFNGVKIFDRATTLSLQAGYGNDESLTGEIGVTDPNGQAVREETVRAGGGNGASAGTAISANGRFIAFASSSSNLVAGDSNGAADIFLFDRDSGVTTRVSTATGGAQANGASNNPLISADGRFITYQSDATNLVSGDTNSSTDIFVFDRETGVTKRVSVSSTGAQADWHSYIGGNSADGRYIGFRSVATNLVSGDTNAASDSFVYDMVSGETTRVSVSSSGSQSNGDSFGARMSADGRFVTYRSVGTNLVAGDSNGVSDIFVFDRLTGQNTRVSLSSAGAQGNGDANVANISNDGRYVSYVSSATNMVTGDSNGVDDIFVYDRLLNETRRVSVSSSGTEANAASTNSVISGSGRYIAYTSDATNLVAGDTNGVADVFVFDLLTGQTTRGNTSTAREQGNASANNLSLSDDGRYLTYSSAATNLISNDTNGQTDVFISENSAIRYTLGFKSAITPLVGLGLKTQVQSLYTQDVLDDYLKELNVAVGTIGALQSRIQIATSTVLVRTENTTAAASRIFDADIAEEAAGLSRGQVIQRAAQSVLAQANLQPELVLSLLQAA